MTAYDLMAADDEQLSAAARRYFKSQPVATASTILMTGLHLIGGIPQWCDPLALLFAAYRRLWLPRLRSHVDTANRDDLPGGDARLQITAA